MRIGRMIATGTMAMGAYRAFKQYKGGGAPTNQKRGRMGSGGLRGREQQPQRGGMFSMLNNRR